MRVLLVVQYFYSPALPVGGAERQALRLSRKLIEMGVDVTVAAGQWDWREPRREEIDDVPVHRHFTGWFMFGMKGFRRISQYLYLLSLFLYLVRHRHQYELIHCQSAMFGASVVVLAARLLRKRTLIRAMASGPWGDITRFLEGKEGTIWGARWMLDKLKQADCVVVLNRQVAEEMRQVGVQSKRIVHIPNGIDAKQLERKVDYRLGHKITVAHVGRLHPQKGVDVLLSAFQEARRALPQFSWELKLVGTGRQQSELEGIARRLAIDPAVQFLGQVDDPFPVLYQSDIFVLPSRSEGISNALLEAMASGLPCIATDIPGNNEVITQREDGLLVQPDDPHDLAQALTTLAADQKLREQLGQAALTTVEERFSLISVASQYEALYADLLRTGAEQQTREMQATID